jgi:hypothetical protein
LTLAVINSRQTEFRRLSSLGLAVISGLSQKIS